MAKIRDVATLANVSTATVSHVINQTTYVSPALRQRVIGAMRELNYHPNAVARSLKTKQSKTVAMVIPDITNPFFPAIVRGAEDVLRHEGYTLLLGNADEDGKTEETYYNTFHAKRVDGTLLIISPHSPTPEYLQKHNPDAFPIVYVDRFYRGLPGDVVIADNVGGSYQAVCHLIENGHRWIAIITGPLELVNARMRLNGYERALTKYRIPRNDNFVRPGRFDARSGYEQTLELLALRKPPTAIFSCNALMTIGCLRAIRERGLRCPEDLALVSFDDLEWFEVCSPSITAVSQPAYELGSTAAELLVKRISGTLCGPPCRKVLTTRLMVRESSGSNSKGALRSSGP
jgi:LacI family transcriptional regulator